MTGKVANNNISLAMGAGENEGRKLFTGYAGVCVGRHNRVIPIGSSQKKIKTPPRVQPPIHKLFVCLGLDILSSKGRAGASVSRKNKINYNL